jgi:hypothetical protein
MAFLWDSKRQRYIGPGGRAVPEAQVRRWIDEASDTAKKRIQVKAQQYATGRITHPDFFSWLDSEISRMNSAVAQIAIGGKKQLTPKMLGRLGALVRREKEYVTQFGLQVERGEQMLSGVVNRSSLYAESIIGHFEQMRHGSMIDGGFTEARNVLGGARHCDECPTLTDWMPIDSYPPPGTRACQSRDRCTTEYR